MALDWSALEQAAKLVASSGTRADGRTLLQMRTQILDIVDEATREITTEAELSATPAAELMLVDRHGWIGGNVSTIEKIFGDLEISGAGSKLVAWEGGGFLGLIARAVLGQYDPFRNQLLIVYPNLGAFADQQGMRWLLFHEVTHVAQFRAAPWIADEIVAAGKTALSLNEQEFRKDFVRQLPERLPELIKWARDAYEGKASTSPLLELLPDEQRNAINKVNAIVTVLEGHATHVTELIAERVLPGHEEITKRIEQRRKRPPLMRILEAIGGIEMKRQQYIAGKRFCEEVWKAGGPGALAPAWRSAADMPSMDEIKNPQAWLDRVSLQTPPKLTA